MKNIYKQAWKDYLKLVELVKGFKGNLEQLCKHLNGYNYDEERFDCNFGALTATVYSVENEFFVFEFLDIWNDEETTIVAECLNYTDLKELADHPTEKGGGEY